MNKIKMKAIVLFTTAVFMLWCVKGIAKYYYCQSLEKCLVLFWLDWLLFFAGYWSSDPAIIVQGPSLQYLRQVRELESTYEKDRLISSLEVQVS